MGVGCFFVFVSLFFCFFRLGFWRGSLDFLWADALLFDISPLAVLFFGVLLFIVLSILAFTFYYIPLFFDFVRFLLFLLSFVVRMVILIFHRSFIPLFLGWDGLGISSYYLVAYYFNWSSLGGAIVTLLTNRFGDCFLFGFLCLVVFRGGFSLRVTSFPLLLLVCCFTKRAQFPFSSWLPLAMRAPTPVSSLVHSSTLVTAGVFLLLKYFFLFAASSFLLVLFRVGLFTSGYSSFLALMEPDIKKVIALRTLSQMGFLVFTLGLGLPTLSFLHLLTHALFKSCLFLQAGLFIHFSFSLQDRRLYGGVGGVSIFSVVVLGVCLISMSGLLFSSGFVRKDIILARFCFSSLGGVFWSLVVLVIRLTLCYSIRLFTFFCSSLKSSLIFEDVSFLYKLFSGGLVVGGVVGGWTIVFNTSFPLLLGFISKTILIGFLLGAPVIYVFVSSFIFSTGASLMGGLSLLMSPLFLVFKKFYIVWELEVEKSLFTVFMAPVGFIGLGFSGKFIGILFLISFCLILL